MASQVNHFKEFATVADYEAYIQPDDYAKPLVALVDETDTVMFPQGGGGGGDCGNPILKSVDIEDFTGTTFQDSRRYITEAVIPASVTSIGAGAFSNCSLLTSVTIPEGVTSIRSSAFSGCTSLTSVTIPDAVTTIDGFAFSGCTSMTSVTIGSSVTIINDQAFNQCSSLTSVTVRATTPPTLGYSIFNNTSSSIVIYVPTESVEAYKAASGWSAYASQIQAIP